MTYVRWHTYIYIIYIYKTNIPDFQFVTPESVSLANYCIEQLECEMEVNQKIMLNILFSDLQT